MSDTPMPRRLTVPQSIRFALRRRPEAKTCAYCSDPATSIDHVVPRAHGGRLVSGNLLPCCNYCNNLKGTHSLVVFLALKRAIDTRPSDWRDHVVPGASINWQRRGMWRE